MGEGDQIGSMKKKTEREKEDKRDRQRRVGTEVLSRVSIPPETKGHLLFVSGGNTISD
jgi:hypothetical protein